MTIHLYTSTDVKRVRDQLVKDQKGIDPILNEPFTETVCTDHDHSTMHVRAALNRNTNAFEGKVFNAYTRCLKWLTDVPLPDILRNLADYYEQDYSVNPLHPSWIKRLHIEFNKLNEADKQRVLSAMNLEAGANGKIRKEIFRKGLLTKNYTYHDTLKLIKGES